jgi:alpha-acetolactate decarboxylase
MRCPPVFNRRAMLVFLSGFLCACLPEACAAGSAIVYDRGSLKEIFKDNAAAKVDLFEMANTEHLYALGQLAGLKGEIMIWDGCPFESHVDAKQVQVRSDWHEPAAYLVWTSVRKWQKTRVPSSVENLAALEMWLASMSGKPGSPLSVKYPFLVKGHFERVAWHIANVHDDGSLLTPAKEEAQRYHGTSRKLKGEILGFYAPDHQGLFIPDNHSTHMHFRISNRLVAHVDDFEPSGDPGLTLYVPAPRRK